MTRFPGAASLTKGTLIQFDDKLDKGTCFENGDIFTLTTTRDEIDYTHTVRFHTMSDVKGQE
jgi:hypothetical protein